MTTATATALRPTSASPSAFRAAHPDIASWSTRTFEVYERLVEAAKAAPLPVRPGLTGLSPVGVAALDRLTESVAYWFDDRQDAHQLAYELAAGGDES